MPFPKDEQRDKPWLMRTYAGHSSPVESNKLYRRNLAKGQTGLSVAFDLPRFRARRSTSAVSAENAAAPETSQTATAHERNFLMDWFLQEAF